MAETQKLVDVIGKHTQQNAQAVQKLEREMPSKIMAINKNVHQGVVNQVRIMIQKETEGRQHEISKKMQNCAHFQKKMQSYFQGLESKISEAQEMAKQAFAASQQANGTAHGVGQGLQQALIQVAGQVQAQSENTQQFAAKLGEVERVISSQKKSGTHSGTQCKHPYV